MVFIYQQKNVPLILQVIEGTVEQPPLLSAQTSEALELAKTTYSLTQALAHPDVSARQAYKALATKDSLL